MGQLAEFVVDVNSQRLERLFFRPVIVVQQPSQIMRDKDTTFLQLPPDEQKLTKPPETDKLSDKNRIATSKSPQLDRQELQKIGKAARERVFSSHTADHRGREFVQLAEAAA